MNSRVTLHMYILQYVLQQMSVTVHTHWEYPSINIYVHASALRFRIGHVSFTYFWFFFFERGGGEEERVG